MKLKNLGYAVAIAATAVMFVLGSAVPSEAAKKKKAAAAPPVSPTCWMTAAKPVCAVKGASKMKFTYNNACYAGNDGAKVVAQKACAPAKAMKGGKKGGKKAMKKAGKKKMKK